MAAPFPPPASAPIAGADNRAAGNLCRVIHLPWIGMFEA